MFAQVVSTLAELLAKAALQIVQLVQRLLEPAQLALLLIQSKVTALAVVVLDIITVVIATHVSKHQLLEMLDIIMMVKIIVSLVVQTAQPALPTQVSAQHV